MNRTDRSNVNLCFLFLGSRPSCLLFMDLATRVNNVNSGAGPFATVYIYLGLV